MRLLVVEDDEAIRRAIQVMLEHQGYTLRTVESAEKALDALGVERPDLILLDLMLPVVPVLICVMVDPGYNSSMKETRKVSGSCAA